MNTSSFSRYIIILFIAILAYTPAHAQHQQELQTISDQMYANGDIHFILVQAYHDKVLYEGQAYKLEYANGKVTINGAAPEEPYSTLYNRKLADFTKSGKDVSYRLTGDGLALKDILNPGSDFRKQHSREQENLKRSGGANMQKILAEMVQDKLIDTSAGYTLSYNTRGLWINNNKLEGALFSKYAGLFRSENGFVPVKDNDGFSISARGKKQ